MLISGLSSGVFKHFGVKLGDGVFQGVRNVFEEFGSAGVENEGIVGRNKCGTMVHPCGTPSSFVPGLFSQCFSHFC